MPISADTLQWIREEPLARHLSFLDDPLVCGRSMGETRKELFSIPAFRRLVSEVGADPWPPINSHRSADHPLHKLSFLAELGLDDEDLGLSDKLDRIIATTGGDGMLGLPMRIPRRYGGQGTDGTTWALCDSPILAYSLVKLGRGKDPRVVRAVRKLIEMESPGGYRCATSPELGFRGPGRKDDPCPYANLIMLKLLSATGPEEEAVHGAAEAALDLWANSRTRHPYLFYMGTDFRKLKYPMIWYDILHVAEVLSRFDRLRQDPRLKEMVSVMAAQGDANGRFTPGSVWAAWKGWDFGQKKAPSRTLTWAVHRVLSRFERPTI